LSLIREPLADLEAEQQSPFFVGRELSPLLNAGHRTKLEDFLAEMESEAKLATFARGGGLVGEAPAEMARALLAAFRRGLDLDSTAAR